MNPTQFEMDLQHANSGRTGLNHLKCFVMLKKTMYVVIIKEGGKFETYCRMC